jgi:DNA repair photolyase
MALLALNHGLGLELAQRVARRYAPVWQGRPASERAALALYFLPYGSHKAVLGVTRPRVVKWYCPFADQRAFPSGHRYCINVYAGCAHRCAYCYATRYVPIGPACKKGFGRMLMRDLDDLDAFDVPPAPVHVSNSTDPFQPLEHHARHTRRVLEALVRRRHRFTTVTVLTKNPLTASRSEYLVALRRLGALPPGHPRAQQSFDAGVPPLRVEVSLAFWRDEVRAALEPGAPSVAARLDGIRRLRRAGIPVALRIDPLFPRGPLGRRAMRDFGFPECQPLTDLDQLLAFAADVGVMHVIYSVAKITRPRSGALPPLMSNMLAVYRHLAGPAGLAFRGGSWRLPKDVARACIVEPFLRLCRTHGLGAKFCKQNLTETP